jgi:hypothetical protein
MTTISELIPDPKNARKRGPRAEGMLVKSLQEVGAARSVVIDENNNILAGNGTIQAAAEAGIERVHVVEADGETIIAVRRSGLTESQKKRLAVLDNRTGELAEWDTEILAELNSEMDLTDVWNENEFNLLLGQIGEPDDPREHWEGMPPIDGDPRACRAINVYFANEADVQEFADKLDAKLTDKTKTLWYPKPPE